jgi:UDP-N-acetylmuramate--alanine ligase
MPPARQAFVIEADEYDRMFLGLKPKLAVVTNVEHDHPDCFPTAEDFYQAFAAFTTGLEPGGCLLACADDPGSARLAAEARLRGQKALTYGLRRATLANAGQPPAYLAENLVHNQHGAFTFDARYSLAAGAEQAHPFELRPAVALQVPGEHNVRNALAALAVAHQLGLPLAEAGQALDAYRGTGRRFELRGEAAGVTVIDDYAHHPTEIRAAIAAARERYPGRPLCVVWQPHTYSRTRMLFDGFVRAFGQADTVLVTEIYASREAPPADGFSANRVVSAMLHEQKHFIPDLAQVTLFLLGHLKAGDVLLVLSAGDADQISTQVLAALQERVAPA